MLIDLILVIVVEVAGLFISLIPEMTFNPDFLSGFESVTYVLGLMSYVVPMKVFLGCLSVFFLLQNITFVIAIVNWIVRKIPTIS